MIPDFRIAFFVIYAYTMWLQTSCRLPVGIDIYEMPARS